MGDGAGGGRTGEGKKLDGGGTILDSTCPTQQSRLSERLPPATLVCFGLFCLPKPEGEREGRCTVEAFKSLFFPKCVR